MKKHISVMKRISPANYLAIIVQLNPLNVAHISIVQADHREKVRRKLAPILEVLRNQGNG